MRKVFQDDFGQLRLLDDLLEGAADQVALADRLAVGVAKNERAMIALREHLPATRFKSGDRDLRQVDAAPALRRFRLREAERAGLVVFLQSLPYRERPVVEIEVLPPQGEQLPLTL